MRRAAALWPEIVSWRNLLAAAGAAARGKRGRTDVARFLLDLEPELCRLRRELLDGTYVPGAYRTFTVREPKPRLISAAPFRDRVVHHALTRVLEPVFEPGFSPRSFACRRGRGTHRALAVARDACRRFRWVLKCDVVKYFATIDHGILRALIARRVACPRTLDLVGRIIAGSNEQGAPLAWFPGDGLFTPGDRRRGLPLGNQTSQFFANVMLDPLDHFVTRRLRPGGYVRYVDDFLLFGDGKRELLAMRAAVAGCAAALRLRLHAGKTRVHRTADGVTFLGFRILPDRVRLVRGNVVRFRRRLAVMRRAWAAGRITWPDVAARVQAWVAHAAHGDTWTLRAGILTDAPFVRGDAA